MNKKSHLTKIISITIALIVLLAGLSIGVTANAATMKYNIDYTKTASLTLYKYEMSDVSKARRAVHSLGRKAFGRSYLYRQKSCGAFHLFQARRRFASHRVGGKIHVAHRQSNFQENRRKRRRGILRSASRYLLCRGNFRSFADHQEDRALCVIPSAHQRGGHRMAL